MTHHRSPSLSGTFHAKTSQVPGKLTKSPTLIHVTILNRVLLHGDIRKHTDQCRVNFVGKKINLLNHVYFIHLSNGKEIGKARVVSVSSEVRCNGFKS